MLRALRITTLLLTLLAIGHGLAEGRSVTCSTALPSFHSSCFLEATSFSVWGLETAVGVEATLDFQGASVDDVLGIAPYFVLGYYADDYAWWLEARVPNLWGVPIIGTTDYLRAGFTIRF